MSSADPFATRQESSADPFATSQGSSEPCDPQKVLESLFNVPRSLKHEPKAMNWRNVAKKMQSLGIDGSSSSGEGSQPDTLGILLWFLDFSVCVSGCKSQADFAISLQAPSF